MKLYNLYESVILEEINKQKRLLTESVSDEAIKAAMDGMYWVNIMYQADDNLPPVNRYIQVYFYGRLFSGNDAIRAFQTGGKSKTGVGKWKIFRVDRIRSWSPTKMRFYNPISDTNNVPTYNQLGDKTFAMKYAQVNPANFNRQRSDIGSAPNKNNVNNQENGNTTTS